MPVDPSISLGIKTPPPPDVLGGISKAISLRDLMAQIQMRQAQTQDIQAQNQQRQRDLQDQQTIQQAFADPTLSKQLGSGDVTALQGKVTPSNLTALQLKLQEVHKNALASTGVDLENQDKQLKLRASQGKELENLGQGILALPDESDRLSAYREGIGRLKASGNKLAELAPDHLDSMGDFQPLMAHLGTLQGINEGASKLLQQQATQQKAQTDADLAAKTEQSDITKVANEALITGEDAAQKHAQTPVVQALSKETLDNPKLLNPQQQQQAVESDRTAKETNRHNLVDESIAAKRQQLELAIKRGDTSYASATRELDNLGKPIQQLAPRLARIQDTLAQNTPAADALVAPELLTVMAGGQGSSLRVNEAEISRSLHGRSHWEDLKAAINKWQLDPKAALSITPEQRSEIRALTSLVSDKLYTKQKALDDAYTTVTGSQDVGVHRQAVLDARKKLESVDLPPQESRGNASGGYQVGHQYGTLVYKGGDPNSQASWGSVGH